MSKQEIKIAVYLCGQPLPASYSIGKDGRPLQQRLVTDLWPAEQEALRLAASWQARKITVVTAGYQGQEALLRKALALGATEAVQIGGADWPLEPDPRLVAAAVKAVLEDDYHMLLCADTGNSLTGIAQTAAFGKALGCPAVSGVFTIEQSEICKVSRKLEKGKRQQLQVRLPAVLALLPGSGPLAPPSMEAQLAALEKPLWQEPLAYSLLSRQVKGLREETDAWQTSALRPQTKAVWQPDSALSGGQRLEAMAHGAIEARHGKQISGTTGECAAGIIDYLLQEGLIEPA